MATKRDGVFVWITWLSRVMAGEQNCEWASWFKAHYENYDKAPSDFDTVKWNIEHTRQLRRLGIASFGAIPFAMMCYSVQSAAGFSPPTPTKSRHSPPLAKSRSSEGSQL